ncbi:uncharacterized protein C8Q71DRAFT_484009 [Rhodofomes roseus]|uniref:Sorting nexin MVP1 n=1 Tax=Rhodofomes roseus TaxID=34475 RepID=A0ABQ8KQ43_9APHY|nr:uncharacterized protein C8Q71DRAFT_484009 [Rhodofomes roseus]KAH9840265.1 hypothetical protein C8Q71DRAFT_484009 [Rhodofomes roseus]
MFNAPRPSQPYGASTSNGLGVNSFMSENPLASSMYDDGLDPWSNSPSPAPPPVPSYPTTSSSGLSSVIGNATVPPIYIQAFVTVDDTNTGETSVSALSRVLRTSALPASTIDKIVSLVSSRPRVSRLEFYVALALAALVQSGKDVSIERVAQLAQDDELPVPTLDLASLPSSNSTFGPYSMPDPPRSIAPRSYSAEDPWSVPKYPSSAITSPPITNGAGPGAGGVTNGATSSIAGTGLPKEWWRKQETIHVNILGQQGFLLNRYLAYEVTSDRGAPVPRRYSEFVFLWDCLVKRYPFRLLPALPPKRVGPDENFLEQRRKGLARFLNFIVNHPIIKDDGVLAVFLTEPSFEAWRKHTSISYEEESASKRVDRVEEMGIPSDLNEKLNFVRGKVGYLIEHWQRICMLAERIIRRREAEAVRVPHLVRRAYLPAHFALPPFSSPSTSISAPTPSSAASSPTTASDTESLASSIFGGFTRPRLIDAQADLSRLTNTMKSLVEVNERCWRGDECELCAGVRQGLVDTATHMQKHSDMLEHRSRTMQYSTLEALKGERDLYIALRDLFIRYDRLSGDQVDRLKKRVDANSLKLEGIKQAHKDGWEQEADKYTVLIEKDQAAIAAALNRRVFVRACMWHELRVVLHNRENTLISQAVQAFAREELDFSESAVANWAAMMDEVANMPYE